METEIISTWVSFLRSSIPQDTPIVRQEALVGTGAVRPVLPFISFKIITGPDDIMSRDNFIWANGSFQQDTVKKFTISIQAYGSTAMELINEIRFNTQMSDKINSLRQGAGISISIRGTATDISVERETGFDRRVSLDLDFIVGLTIPTNYETIELVNVEQADAS